MKTAILNDCVTSSLDPFQPNAEQWTAKHVAHLYNSFGHGANYATIQNGLTLSPSALVSQLLDEAIAMPQPEAYPWSEYTQEDYDNDPDPDLVFIHFDEIQDDWMLRGLDYGFQQKMSLFWHDHFATEENVYGCNRYMYRYYKLLHENAFGNFRTFVEEMGVNEAMLVYLDGNENEIGEPNENYARELMELFTMGENNGYTQTDIEEMAKALTGWRVRQYLCEEASFDEDFFDDSVKNIFGQSGNFGYDDVHELIFSLRKNEVATYICSKLYRHFVFETIDEEVVAGMTETFIASDWEIRPVLEQLLSSEHFYETVFHGAKIKSPVGLVCNFITTLGLDRQTDLADDIGGFLNNICIEMGQELFNPPNVAGWPGNRFWLSENALAFRWSFLQRLITNGGTPTGREKLRSLALEISPSENDPVIITQSLLAHLLSVDLDDNLIEVAVLFLRAGIPDNYFEDGSWSLYWDEAPGQIANLLGYVVQLPEFQLT